MNVPVPAAHMRTHLSIRITVLGARWISNLEIIATCIASKFRIHIGKLTWSLGDQLYTRATTMIAPISIIHENTKMNYLPMKHYVHSTSKHNYDFQMGKVDSCFPTSENRKRKLNHTPLIFLQRNEI